MRVAESGGRDEPGVRVAESGGRGGPGVRVATMINPPARVRGFPGSAAPCPSRRCLTCTEHGHEPLGGQREARTAA